MSRPLVLVDPGAPSPERLHSLFSCSYCCHGAGAAWVDVRGELDIATAPQLRQTLREAQFLAPLVVLDLRAVDFIDSGGVREVVTASTRARRTNRRLIVLRAPSHVDRVFALTGASDAVEVVDLDTSESPAQALLRLAGTSAT